MMQPGMHSTWIHKVSKSHLVYIPETLIPGMRNDLQDQWMVNSNKPINRIVDDLARNRHASCVFVKGRTVIVVYCGKSTNASLNKLFLKTAGYTPAYYSYSNYLNIPNGSSKNNLG